MSNRILYIYPDEQTADQDGRKRPNIIIDSAMKKISEEQANETYSRLVRADVESILGVPFYAIFKNRIWRNRWQNTPGPEYYSTELLITVYEVIEDRIESENIETVCHTNLSILQRRLLSDICDSHDCAINDRHKTLLKIKYVVHMIGLVFQSLFILAVQVLDQILSICIAKLFSEPDSSIILIFSAGRPKTMRPLIQAFDNKPDIIFNIMTISYLKKHHGTSHPEFDARPIHTFSSIKSLYSSLRISISLYIDLFYHKSLAGSLTDAVEESEGVDMEQTLSLLFRYAILPNLRSLFVYQTAEVMFNHHNYDSIFIPTLSRTAKSVVLTQGADCVDVYHLPHTVGLQYSRYQPDVKHTVFTSGDLDASYIGKSEAIRPIVTGYPKHIYIRDMGDKFASCDSMIEVKKDRIVIATQPYPDRIRRKFINDTVDILLSNSNIDILIKPHPGEDLAYYRTLLSDLGYNRSDRVDIVEDNIYRYISESKLVLTIGSNVGIESVLLDTPAVCYNIWKPFLRTPLFSKYGTIPQIESFEKFETFVTDLDTVELLQQQRSMLVDDYKVRDNSIEQIADQIRSTLE